MLLEDFIETYFSVHVSVHNKESTTIAKHQILRRSIIPVLGDKALDAIGRADITIFIATCHKLGLKPKTINNHITCLRNLFTVAYDMDLISNIPPIKRVKLFNTDRRSLTAPELRALVAGAEQPFWQAFIRLTALTGLRIGELRALEWSHVKLRHEQPQLRISQTTSGKRSQIGSPKGGRVRSVFLNVEAIEILNWLLRHSAHKFVMALPLLPEEPISYRRCERAMLKARKAAGIEWCAGWHTLRHTFASNLAASGQGLVHIKELLGHVDISTTMKYSHLLPSDLSAVVNTLPSIRPEKD